MKTIIIKIEQDAEAGHIATAIYDAVRALGVGVTIDRGQHLESSQPTAMSPIVAQISSFDVPEPLRTEPKHGAIYFAASPLFEGGFAEYEWEGDTFDRRQLENGMAHASAENAAIHSKALISLTKKAAE
jgi:hypothetical protein